jgi:hypothetical protein
MSDYTPTTEEVREFISKTVWPVAEFDSWLVQERKRVAEMAMEKERKRILTMLEEIDPETNLYGAILAIRSLDD